MLISCTVGRIVLLALCVYAFRNMFALVDLYATVTEKAFEWDMRNCLRDATVVHISFSACRPWERRGSRPPHWPILPQEKAFPMVLPMRLNVRAIVRSRGPMRASARDASTFLPYTLVTIECTASALHGPSADGFSSVSTQ